MTGPPGVDRWAEWLLRGRDAPLTEPQRRDQAAHLHGLRDRVLAGAQIGEDDRVLDIGAGTGLLALEAARIVGGRGVVSALDISHDALAHCRREAAELPLRCVAGDATRLPFPDASFDVVMTRSALIYVWDKQKAVDEMRRVLRSGGRVSLFEPINAAARLIGLEDDEVPEAISAEHRRVMETFQARSEHWEPMMGFDERDLVRTFVTAGFEAVGLDYTLLATQRQHSADDAERLLDLRGNPTAPTLREAAIETLGADAHAYLDALVTAQAGQPRPSVSARAFLTATR